MTLSVAPSCSRPGCENEVSKNRHSNKTERPYNVYCSRACYHKMPHKYRDGKCSRGHEMVVTGTRTTQLGVEVPKRHCPLCRLATRYARLHGIPVEVVLAHPPAEACEICGVTVENKKLCLDHNHETGELRGWLCNGCNSGLGHFGDNPETIVKALAYLKDRGSYGSTPQNG